MRAGGIFGEGALGALGIAVDTGVESWDMGGAAAKAACYAAGKLGESDRISGKPMVTTTAYSRIGYLWASQKDQTRVSECYANGYMSVTPATTDTTKTGTTTSSSSNETSWVGPMPDTGAGKACTDSTVIASVQGQLGVAADGKWGPISQAALTKSGKTFKSLAPECKEPVPYYGGTSGGTTSGGGGSLTPASTAFTPQSSASRWTSSPVFWAVALAVGVGGYLYLSGGKKGKKR